MPHVSEYDVETKFIDRLECLLMLGLLVKQHLFLKMINFAWHQMFAE